MHQPLGLGEHICIVIIIDILQSDAFLFILKFNVVEDLFIELLMQFLIRIVDVELFKAIVGTTRNQRHQEGQWCHTSCLLW
jgi:hypothetical protein